ncbi:unnamed protein product [Trichobilharzia szidati]|nr:unnamed protein product [Trichobilharzia szidati]
MSVLDAGRIASRLGKDSGDSVGDSFSHRNLLSLHSDSDSDTETVDVVSNVVGRSSTSTGGGGGSSTTGASSSAGSSGVAGGIVSTSSNVLSTIVEFGSNLFRPDLKKSIRGKRSVTASSNLASGGANTADSLEAIAAQEANLEREYIAACYPVARCIAAIEKQANGLATHGIYRVPASKAKVSSLMDLLQSSQPNSSEQINKDIDVLCQEHPLTLASLVKTQLIALPEPLLTYNLYPNFVELGKAFDLVDSNVSDELMKRLQLLINHLSPGNRQLAGLIFHHLHRVAECQTENQMGAANLGTMFAPTVLRQRPKFQVANMMEFMDNKGQTKVVELLIDRVFHVFGSSEQYDPIKLIISHITSDTDKAVIADYNRMQTARGSISLAGCERSKSTSGTVSDELSEMGGSLINKTELKTTTSASIPTTTFSITGISSGNIPSNNNNKGNGSTPSSSGLLRSATISVSSHTRAAGTLLSGALPLYTPFRSNQPSSKETEESSNTVNTNATTTSVYPEDKVITSRTDTIHGKQNPSTSEKLINVRSGVRLQDLAKTTGDPSSNVTSHTSSVVTSGTSGGSESSSIVRGIKRLYSTGNQHCTSSTISMTPNASSKLFSSSDKQHPSTLKSTASNSSSSSADSHTNTTLSSLVIGRRKPLGRLLTVHQSTEASSDSATTPNPLDLDQYSFIDNDLSEVLHKVS